MANTANKAANHNKVAAAEIEGEKALYSDGRVLRLATGEAATQATIELNFYLDLFMNGISATPVSCLGSIISATARSEPRTPNSSVPPLESVFGMSRTPALVA
jgi:hypothetical protein